MICNSLQECIKDQVYSVPYGKCDNKNETKCIEVSGNRSLVKAEENGKKYIYENTKGNHVVLYKMDGGIIVEDKTVPPNTSKCDYLFVVKEDGLTAILTELKGVNVAKALEQLGGTLLLYKDVFKNFKRVYARAVVTSSTPNLKATPAYTNLEKALRLNYNGNIKIRERQFQEKDTELDKIKRI